MRSLRLGVSFSVLVVLLAVWAMPSVADAHFPYDAGYPPDLGAYHSYCYGSSIDPIDDPVLYDRIRDSEGELAVSTNVEVQLQDPCVTTGSGRTDVWWRTGDCGIICIGFTECLVRNSNDLCDQYRVTMNKAYIESQLPSGERGYEFRHTACHELGHSVTLSHYSGSHPSEMSRDDCMKSGFWTTGSYNSHSYDPGHHIPDHINDWFCSGCTAPDPLQLQMTGLAQFAERSP